MVEVFNLIVGLKEINKQKLIVRSKDHMLFFRSYFKNKIYKKIGYIGWMNCLINYRVDNMKSFDDSILFFLDYLKNNDKRWQKTL